MATPIKAIFDDASRDVKFDDKLAKKIRKYLGDLCNRDENTVMFLGSNLTGVYPLRFKTSDRNEWMIDVKDIDEFAIRSRVIKESIYDASWVRVNDVFNLDCMYSIHRYLNSSLPKDKIQQITEDIAMVLNLKLLGSIMARYFPYGVDERVAQVVYARLSRKFHIRKYGTWRKTLENRSADIVSEKSIWYNTLKDFNDDAAIAQCISDIQGRLRSMIKYVWDVFEKVRADEARFGRTQTTIELEGDKVLQSIKRDSDRFVRYGQDVVMDKNTFIKPEVLAVIESEMKNMPQKLLLDLLDHVVNESNRRNKKISELVEVSVQHCVNTINDNRTAKNYLHDISWLINKEKLLFMASKTNDPLVFKARAISESLVKEACKTKNPTIIASLRTGLIIYIIGRTFTMDYYTR